MNDTYKEEAGIYIFTNKINGKVYVGESFNLKNRMMDYRNPLGDRPFEKALRKYGLNGFHIEVEYFPNFSKKDLLDLEQELIKRFSCLVNQNGYNVCERGNEYSNFHDKSVKQYSKDAEFIKEFKSIELASKELSIKRCNISHTCRGLKKSAGGFLWTYSNSLPPDKFKSACRKRVQQYSSDGVFIKEFESVNDASKKLGVDRTSIGKCCNNNQKLAGGFKFRFSES